MVRLHDLEVEFLINNQPAEELKDPTLDDVQDEVTRYIQADAGALFAFRCTIPPGYSTFGPCSSLSFKLVLDGVWRRSCNSFLRRDQFTPLLIDGGHYKTDTGMSLRAFKFADLHTHDRDMSTTTISEQMESLQNTGLAKIEVWRKSRAPQSREGPSRKEEVVKEAHPLEVHEKAVKSSIGNAVLLGSNMGDVVQSRTSARYTARKVDEKPIATFNFKYRSKDALQQLGINHTPPRLILPFEQQDPATLTHEESREALRRLQLQLQPTSTSGVGKREMTSGGLKSERGAEDNAAADPSIKKERAEVIEIEDDD